MKVKRTRQESGDYFVVGPDADPRVKSITRSMAVSYAIDLAGKASRQGREQLWQVYYGEDGEPLVSIVSHAYPSSVLVSIQPLETIA